MEFASLISPKFDPSYQLNIGPEDKNKMEREHAGILGEVGTWMYTAAISAYVIQLLK